MYSTLRGAYKKKYDHLQKRAGSCLASNGKRKNSSIRDKTPNPFAKVSKMRTARLGGESGG